MRGRKNINLFGWIYLFIHTGSTMISRTTWVWDLFGLNAIKILFWTSTNISGKQNLHFTMELLWEEMSPPTPNKWEQSGCALNTCTYVCLILTVKHFCHYFVQNNVYISCIAKITLNERQALGELPLRDFLLRFNVLKNSFDFNVEFQSRI